MSEIFRPRIAVLVIAIFCSLALPTKSHGATFAATLQNCAVRLGLKSKDTSPAIVSDPAIESEGPKRILNINEPDAGNKIWVAKAAQIFETHLELNHSLEYVPHSLYSEVHAFIDKTIASKEQDLFKAIAFERITSRSEKKIKELVAYLKEESQRLNTQAVRQVDFFYFAENAVRLFSLFDKDGISRRAFAKHASLFSGTLIIRKTEMNYEVWRNLSLESLLVPTSKELSIADFNLASPYPIYFFAVSKDSQVADGVLEDSEGNFSHDKINHVIPTSRFYEVMKELTIWKEPARISSQDLALLKQKIEKNLNFLDAVYALLPNNIFWRERRLVATTLFYSMREEPVLGTLSSKDATFETVLENWSKIFTYDFVEKFSGRIYNERDLGFYFGKRVTGLGEIHKALDILKSALTLTLKKPPLTSVQ